MGLRAHKQPACSAARTGAMRGALKRYDPERKVLMLSEVLRRGSRSLHVAYHVGLLTQNAAIDGIAQDPACTKDAGQNAVGVYGTVASVNADQVSSAAPTIGALGATITC